MAKQLASRNRAERRQAIEIIAGRRLAAGLPELERIAASDVENDLRMLADRVVRFLRDEGRVPTPVPPLPEEFEPVVAELRAPAAERRLDAVRALVKARTPAAVPMLIERAWGERDPVVKMQLARALAVSADLPQRGPIIGALQQAVLVDLDARVRREALLALDLLDARESAEKVIERRRDPDDGCRHVAEALLARWGGDVLLTAARTMLLSPTIGTREAAVHALADARRPEAVPLLAWALTDPLPPVSDAARAGLEALAGSGVAGAADALATCPPAPAPAAGGASGVSGEGAAGASLSSASHESGASSTSSASDASGAPGAPSAPSASSAARAPGAPLASSGAGRASAANEAAWASSAGPVPLARSSSTASTAGSPGAGSTPPPSATPRDPLESAEAPRRLQEIRDIVARGDASRAPALVSRLARENDPFVQSALVNALGKLQAAGVLPSFIPLLDSTDQRVRANAVEAIGWLGSLDDRKRLIPLLSDKNNRVRANAAVACHGLPGIDVRPMLVEMLASDDVWTRKSAVYAIRTLGDPELGKLLKT